MRSRGATGDAHGRSTEPSRRRQPATERLAHLYDAHAGAVLTFLRRYTPDQQSAEDLTQETFLRAWRHLDTITADRNPRAYLLTTARNLLTDRWRQQRNIPAQSADGLEQVPTAADDIDSAMTGILVGEALQRLTADHRAVVQLLFYDGWTVTETASLLAIPPGTVKSRSYYALRALRAALDELGVTR
jgi:RNA polymerase sigma-70 factor (ECF subfamily)